MDNSKQGLFDLLNAKSAFWLGVITAVLILGTLGFLFTGSAMMKGTTFGNNSGTYAIADNSNNPTDDEAAVGGAVVPEAQPTAIPAVSADDNIRGNKDAKVTIIEYSDFECPFCSNFHPTLQQVMDTYGDDVRWVYRHFPLSFHPEAQPAANAAECAGEQGKFWEYADELFANQTQLGATYYEQLAGTVGINVSKWKDCFTKQTYNNKIDAQAQAGAAGGVTGTPGSFIIDKDGNAIPLKGALPFSNVAAAIDQILAQ